MFREYTELKGRKELIDNEKKNEITLQEIASNLETMINMLK